MIPSVADLRAYCRIEHASENALLEQLIARAVGMLEGMTDVPLVSAARTWQDDPTAPTTNAGPKPATRYARNLWLPHRAVTVTAITDKDGVTVDPSGYVAVSLTGLIARADGGYWSDGPYTIAYTTGVDQLPAAASLAPAVTAAVIDLAADLYQRRTPGAISEGGAQASVTWHQDTVARVMPLVRRIRLAAVA
jgi:hypothetical protein